MRVILILISAALLQAPGGDAALEPWASKAQPGDVAKRHVEEFTQAEHIYTVVHGGTVDGECCRTPMGCGINREGVIEQSWQSNRAVRMENVGQSDLINPWLSNGRNNFRTLDEIVASAVTPGMSDKEKAMALWFQQVSHRFHRGGYGANLGDPVQVFKFEVEVTATIDRQVRKLDEGVLGWGNEKVLSTSTERVGSASQRFVIEVSP